MNGRARAFTLLEVLLALSIVGILLTIAFGGLRVAMAAWRQGEDRVEAHQHVRAVALSLTRALGAAYPYRATKGTAPEIVTLFDGAADRVAFVSQRAPFPLSAPIAFTAVVVALEQGDTPGLVVRERALPNQEPFDKAEVVMHDPGVTALTFKFLDDGGEWTDTWDGAQAKTIPRAVQVQVSATLNGRAQTLPPITVTLRAAPVTP
ncbi:MAG TPA: type II secretion system protein GspJ [Methylomirabilota bacterium]|jgi:general secretion pathway protein J|nr:type II secretion system protein GspJ [Methylomirabilota bacterium]